MSLSLSREQHKSLNWLSRAEIVAILENYGFQCYDHESDDDLKTALRTNIEDNTIPESVLDA